MKNKGIEFCRVSGGIASCIRNFRTDFLEEWPTPGTGPHFDTSMQSNFTGLVGKTVHLVCKVKNLGNRTVSLFLHIFFFFFYFSKIENIFLSYIYTNFKLNNWKLYENQSEENFSIELFRAYSTSNRSVFRSFLILIKRERKKSVYEKKLKINYKVIIGSIFG